MTTELRTHETTQVIPLPTTVARALTTGGAALTIVSTFLAWTWTPDFPGDLSVTGYPGGLQILTLVGGALTLLFAIAGYNVPALRWLTPSRSNNAVLTFGIGAFAITWYTLISIAYELGGLANLEPGGFVAGIAALTTLVGALGLHLDRNTEEAQRPEGGLARAPFVRYAYLAMRALRLSSADRPLPDAAKLPGWIQRIIITIAAAIGLELFSYGIDTEYGELFVGFLILAGFGAAGLYFAGLTTQFSQLTAANRGFAATMGFLAAAAFPFTQSNDHYANIGVNILIFGTVALGLNIVVGLTGLLDLGYVAFLGVGAYAAALVSGSEYSVFSGAQFPFWAAALTGMGASLVFGVLIGAPTLRLRGDYLAIVTLGFGEIFRIAVNNMDGTSGPNVTNGPNGINQIPDLSLFGYNLGASHTIGSFTLGRFANYFFLMLLITVLVVLIFTRAADSRIGRAWVAIREDETAATAMGINGFRVKLVAFALGASLAGLAGTVSAHVTYSVTPAPYQFAGAAPPNSAFLLAAVVLGGMGTVNGPLLGAALLYLIPEKLAFLQNYELFAFGIALILIMRFRPEGIIADRRRKLEFHEDGGLLLPDALDGTAATSKAGA
ncbi:branched-chain amino acid ABC transporter permease [Streptomyces sp. H10-C2]|uniref:branched-chain amino acid ABC transporter permease n=1 Tax=unclassified Streptomyces TaxID=2593676 RepID=UPI0024BBB017|nr:MULTISPECIES: branched-chain amino acid ABC transporter permease [unclassified Streptomyces]MDJ0344484.1 branched-chain amino acid ABC transporter permease [Streptomyces sp. PH10-H1]MDJ0369642.1 branched-chain amino acid ABC transporter permease [Streptomyces sp. H10-C2]